MSRTKKDLRSEYLNLSPKSESLKNEPGLRSRYRNFKLKGAHEEGEYCLDCGGLTDFRAGFITCSECGKTEGVIEVDEVLERLTA